MSDLIGLINLLAPFFGLIGLGFLCGKLVRQPESGLAWTPTLPLTAEHVERSAVKGPGMLVLTAVDAPDEVVWAEASKDVRARLRMFSSGQHNLPDLVAERLRASELGFRSAAFGQPTGEGPSVIDVLLPSRRVRD